MWPCRQVNDYLFNKFALGQHYLLMGKCEITRPVVRDIVAQMAVPLMQGTIRCVPARSPSPDLRCPHGSYDNLRRRPACPRGPDSGTQVASLTESLIGLARM